MRNNAGNKGAGGNERNNWRRNNIILVRLADRCCRVYRIIEKVLPYADEVHEHTSVYQLNELDFMYRQLSSDMQEEYVSLLTVFENLEALYICRNVITVYPDCKSMIDVARQKLMNDPTFKHLSEDCQEYYFDFEAYASHLQEHGKFLVTEHGIFELPE